MQTFPKGVTGVMSSSGGVAPISLVEIATASGNQYFWSEQRGFFNSVLNGSTLALTKPIGAPPIGADFVEYREWLVGKQQFHLFGSTQTDTGTLSVQNLSGNTVQRDVALAYAKNEFIGAFVYYRLWRSDAEYAIFQFAGNVVDADIDEQTMDLSLEGFGNYSAIRAPAYAIDVACPLFFASMACGSTSPTPCQQSYGTCTSIERFAGAVVQWDFSNGATPLVQIAQPPPVAAANLARTF